MSSEGRQSDQAADVLPAGLLSRPSVRRGSVFSDLLTIFRRNSSHPSRLFQRSSGPSVSTYDESKKQETEAFLEPNASGQAQVQGQGQEEEPEEDGKPMSRQVLLDKIRQKKEVIGKLRCQAWNMNRKRRTLRLAQKYLEQHESRVSRAHLYKEELKKKWNALCRWADNVKIYLIPWEAKIKRIESHFGSVVSSYFTFLRWIVYVNLMITLIIISFIVIPEMVADAAADAGRVNRTASRKIVPPRERIHADELQVVMHFDGYLKYSPLFYGYYSNDEFVGARVRYAVPLAYFIITLFVFGYSCFAILRKMAMNARLSKMSGTKTDQYTFSWKLFTGWDYTIGNNDTASNTAMAIIIKLRESIAECRLDSEKKFQPVLFLARVLANTVILAMLAFSIYTISFAVQSSETVEKTGSLFTKNQVPTIIATITHVFPMIFDLIGQIERYHPRTALRAHLTRVLVLYVLNYITFIIALFEKLDKIRGDELMKIIDERNGRSKRLLNEQHFAFFDSEQLPVLTTFLSRNFTGITQASKFVEASLERFSNSYEKSFEIRERTRRKRQTSRTRKPSSRLPDGTTVESQYGPVGLNNPNALLFNQTYPPDRRRFQTIRVGPPPLPTFTIPPLPPKPTLSTDILTELGPHWQSRSKWRPSKTSTVSTTAAAKERSASRTSVKSTRIPWSGRRTKPKPRPKTTAFTTVVTSDSRSSTPSPANDLSTQGKGQTTRDDSVSIAGTTVTGTSTSSNGASSAAPHRQSTETSAEAQPVSATVPTDNAATAIARSSTDLRSESGTAGSTRADATTAAPKITTVATDSTVLPITGTVERESTTKDILVENVTSAGDLANFTETVWETFAGNETWPDLTTALTTGTSQFQKNRTGTDELVTEVDRTLPDVTESAEITLTVTETPENATAASHEETVTTPDQMAEAAPEQKLLPNGSMILVVNDTYSRVLDGTLGNQTLYQIGQKARITTEEVEMEDHFCWETMIGQEIVKLVTMDLIITIASIFIIDFFRGLWIKYCSSWWCWDIETTFPEYGEFKVAENVLHIINNQGMVWLGLFFAPLLPALNNLKLIVVLYIRAWACMACNVPAREIFRASRSSNFYLMVLLLWLLLCTLPVGYVIASKRPSLTCGPFAGYAKFYNVLTQMLEGRVDRKVMGWLRYIASPGVVIPVLLLLMLIIYFLVSLVRGLREANNDLQQQLIHERTEEKKKIFELAGGGTKKKASETGREKKKRVVTYLPLVEQKRREPWRAYNGRDYDSSLCVTDETSTVTTAGSEQSPSPKNARKKQQATEAAPSGRAKMSAPATLQDIIREESNERSFTADGSESKGLIPISTSNVTDRAEDWFNEEATPSPTQPYNISSNVVEEATPEEIRQLGGSSTIDQSSLPSSSRYEPEIDIVVPSRAAAVTVPVHQLWNGAGSQVSTLQFQSGPLTPKADEGTAFSIAPAGERQIPQEPDVGEARGPKTPDASSVSSRTGSARGTNHEFVPWPSSVEKVQAQPSRPYELQQKPIANGGGHPSRSRLPAQRRPKSPVAPDREDAATTSQSPPQQQRRFRISVSPSRRLQTQTDPSGSDTDTSTGKRRYVIKQEVLPDSSISVNVDSRLPQQQVQSPQAPKVEFGDDDSPKVHQHRSA